MQSAPAPAGVRFQGASGNATWLRRDSSYCLNKSTFGKAHRSRSGDHEVIEDFDVDECERLFECLCEQLVGPARFGHTGRVVVRKCDVRSH